MEVSVSSQMHSHNCNPNNHKLFYSLLFSVSAAVWCQNPQWESLTWDCQCRDTGRTIAEVSSPEVVKSLVLKTSKCYLCRAKDPRQYLASVLIIHSKYRISKNKKPSSLNVYYCLPVQNITVLWLRNNKNITIHILIILNQASIPLKIMFIFVCHCWSP